MSKSLIRDKAKLFAVRVIRLYQKLQDEKREFVMSKQLLRSGTGIGANLAEQEYAFTEPDYLSKTSIALKEAAESSYWLDLLFETNYLNKEDYESYKTDCVELIRMLAAAVKTLKNKLGKK